MKLTTSMSASEFETLLFRYKNNLVTNDELSLMTKALRKRLERQARKEK
jgi:hypothetical protein